MQSCGLFTSDIFAGKLIGWPRCDCLIPHGSVFSDELSHPDAVVNVIVEAATAASKR